MNRHVMLAAGVILPLCLAAQDTSPGDPAVLLIRVVQGRGSVHLVGSRSATVLTVEVTNDAAEPVSGAAVSFQLPATGPGGLFSNGLTTDVMITGPNGRASVSGVRWNKTPGPFDIRVAAVKGQVRAATVVPKQLSAWEDYDSASGAAYEPSRSRLKAVLLVAGAAAGSVAVGLALGRRSQPGSSPDDALSVGMPAITVTGP